MRIIFILLIGGLSFNLTNAQVISGRITDAEQKPLPKAPVSLLNASDSSLVKTQIANAEGIYRFEKITSGKYLLMASSVGFERVYSTAFEYDTTVNM